MALGTMTFGSSGYLENAGHVDLDEARSQTSMAIERGVNLFDTADVYSTGASETVLGQALGRQRDEVLLATKVRFATGSGPNDVGLSKHHIVRACEQSLQRLNTDYIDLYQLHEWDGATPLDETAGAMDALIRDGKIRYVGCSNFTGWQLERLIGAGSRIGLAINSNQVYYSLQDRTVEHGIVQAGLDRGVGTVVYSALAGGLLSGRYRRGVASSSGRHASAWDEPPVHDWNRVYDIVDALIAIADDREATPSQIALAWVLGRAGVSSVVVGARSTEQLSNSLDAATTTLSTQEHELLERVSRPALPYPLWHQVKLGADRMSDSERLVLQDYLEAEK
ncbi:MAG: aldo/keto reductase [Rhodococcus sp. (in: high G+C Gram-positive bacteria)]